MPPYNTIPFGAPAADIKHTFKNDNLTIEQMTKDWEYLKKKTEPLQSDAEFLRQFETYQARDLERDQEVCFVHLHAVVIKN